jgi:hypothetical protein
LDYPGKCNLITRDLSRVSWSYSPAGYKGGRRKAQVEEREMKPKEMSERSGT